MKDKQTYRLRKCFAIWYVGILWAREINNEQKFSSHGYGYCDKNAKYSNSKTQYYVVQNSLHRVCIYVNGVKKQILITEMET